MVQKDNPDRRPLLYGIAALLIIVAALFLFWPRGDHDGSMMTFTPSTPEGEVQAGHMEVPADQEESSPGTAVGSSASKPAPEDVAAEPILEHGSPNSTNSSSDQPTKTTGSRTSSTSDQPTRTVSSRSASSSGMSSLNQPTSSGRYLLYLGSFGSYANAQKRATGLKSKGVPADVAQASKADGTLIYRVRVAYFEGHSKAKAYGDDLKKRLRLDYWIAER